MVCQDVLITSSTVHDVVEFEGHVIDDMSGKVLNHDLVIAAMKQEMQTNFEHKAYGKVPISEAIRVTGKQPIGCRWIDISKSHDENPEYRSRLVAKEINKSP